MAGLISDVQFAGTRLVMTRLDEGTGNPVRDVCVHGREVSYEYEYDSPSGSGTTRLIVYVSGKRWVSYSSDSADSDSKNAIQGDSTPKNCRDMLLGFLSQF